MGRPPQSGGPAFRFMASEVAEMEACLQDTNNAVPTREVLCSFADKFSASPDRAGKIIVQPKQVWNWFQNRRYAQKAKTIKSPAKLSVSPVMPQTSSSSSSGRSALDTNAPMEFEARSARDGAWYDVATFIAHRTIETADLEVRVRFAGFGSEEDEWVNVRKHVRQRSLPCEASECVAVLPGDLILCFQEGKDQALYFDAHVLDAQRRRHDIRGCRCRFLVRYDHDLSEEIVPLRKVCRRPETDYRLHLLHASKEVALEAKNVNTARKQEAYSAEAQDTTANVTVTTTATTTATATATASGEGDKDVILKRQEEVEEDNDDEDDDNDDDEDDDDDDDNDDDDNDDEQIEELLPASTTV